VVLFVCLFVCFKTLKLPCLFKLETGSRIGILIYRMLDRYLVLSTAAISYSKFMKTLGGCSQETVGYVTVPRLKLNHFSLVLSKLMVTARTAGRNTLSKKIDYLQMSMYY